MNKVNSNYQLINTFLLSRNKTWHILRSVCGVCCPLVGLTHCSYAPQTPSAVLNSYLEACCSSWAQSLTLFCFFGESGWVLAELTSRLQQSSLITWSVMSQRNVSSHGDSRGGVANSPGDLDCKLGTKKSLFCKTCKVKSPASAHTLKTTTNRGNEGGHFHGEKRQHCARGLLWIEVCCTLTSLLPPESNGTPCTHPLHDWMCQVCEGLMHVMFLLQ